MRDWLYVLDHCRGIDLVYHKGRTGETYNIGSRNEQKNSEVAQKICDMLDQMHPRPKGKSYRDLISFIEDRPGHDWRYSIDPHKIEHEISWTPTEDFESGLRKTLEWYIKKYL